MKEIAIVYMVAGISSRFGGKIKQLIKITDEETLIEYSLKQSIKAGITKIIFIVGNKTESAFKELFKSKYRGIPVYYALQKFDEATRERPWGTADALMSTAEIINCPFIVCNGDDIYGESTFKILADHLIKINSEEAIIGYKLIDTLPESGKVNRGIIKTEDSYVKEIVETFGIEKSNLGATNTFPEDLCSMNIFALHPKTLKILGRKVESFKQKYQDDKRAECLLPTEISNLIKSDNLKIRVYPATEKWFGVTNPEDEEIVRKIIKKSLS